MSKFGPSAYGPACPIPKGKIGSRTPPVPEIVQRRSRAASWICIPTPSASGGAAGRMAISSLVEQEGRGRGPFFPPRDQAVVKAIACEAVCQTKLPLSRLSTTDLAARAASALAAGFDPAPSGVFSTPTLSSHGVTSTGSFPVTRTLPRKLGDLWICTPASGRVSRWVVGTTLSAPMKRPASRLGSVATRPCRQAPGTHARRDRVRARRGFAVFGRLGRPTWARHGTL